MGQNLVAYERSYRSMLGLADRLDAVLSRIDSLEGAVSSTFAQMQTLAEELQDDRQPAEKKRKLVKVEDQKRVVPSILRQVKANMVARMQEIERRMTAEIHDCMEPSAGFIQRKRKQRQDDAFLNFITLFDDL